MRFPSESADTCTGGLIHLDLIALTNIKPGSDRESLQYKISSIFLLACGL
jgi:hypothetical protein